MVGSARRKRLWRCGIAICWIAALSRPALGGGARLVEPPQGQVRFRVFGGADGLHNLAVRSVAQDATGFLWIGTDDGVYRFDGESFTHFTVLDGLLTSATAVVAAAADGAICVGSDKGLVCWDGTRFSRARARGLPDAPITTMASAGGALWLGVRGHGLYVGGGGGFAPAPGWPGAPATAIRALWADGEGVVVGNGASVALSSGDGTWRSLGDVGLGPDEIDGVLRDRDGALWIRTQAHLWFLPRGASRAIDLHEGLPSAYRAARAPVAMVLGPRGDVLIATDDGVAYRDGDRWRTIQPDLAGPLATGTPRAPVRTLFVDRDATLWLGAAGLVQVRGRGIVERHGVASGLPGESVWLHARDRSGRLLVGTNRCLARAETGGWRCVPGTEGRLVTGVAFPPQGGMFVGGAPSELLYIDDAGVATSLGAGQRPARNIRALAIGVEGDLWIGRGAGLYRLRGAVPGPFERVEVPGAQDGSRFQSIHVIGDQMWLTAAPGGLFLFERGTWRRFGTADGFRSDALLQLVARRDGRFCVTYDEALGVTCFGYDGTITGVEHVTTANGLTSDAVYFVGEDRERRLWVGTGNGVDIITAEGSDRLVDHLDEGDGLAGNDSSSRAFLLDDDGSVWLGATGGTTHVLAQHYRGPPPPPRVLFLHGRVGDRPVSAGALVVPHDRGALTVDVAVASLVDGQRVEYQQLLAPLEAEWTTSRQRRVRYPVLLPGTYRFAARARIDAGPWGPVSEIAFTVAPAWWQTGWFVALVALAGVLVVGGAFTWRHRAVLRRRTRSLNEQSEASFRAVVDLMPELISVQRGRRLVYLNLASRRMLGDRAHGDWRLIDVIDRVHPEDRRHATVLFDRITGLAPQQASEITELRIRGADGTWRICEVSWVRVEIGGVSTVVVSGRDVTERKRMHAKLLVSDRMASLGTLAAGIAHEINNPLAYVTGNLETIEETLEGAASEDARREIVAAIHDARSGAERVRKIVLGLRSLGRAEEDHRVPLELTGILDAAIRMTAPEVRRRAQLVRELGAVPLVIGDDGRLTQVFINLLVNAAQAIPAGRPDDHRITARTYTDGAGHAVIEIEDTGTGMAPEIQARVFDPFFTTKDVGVGTGLGLSICHGIISALGGQISIESPPPGSASSQARGTVVRIVLPAHVPAAVPAFGVDAIPSALSGARRYRVMIVDDEPLMAQTVGRLLRNQYDVTIAQGGQEAIAHIVRGVRFDVIVSDVMMPNMSGIELVEELQRVAPDQAQRLIFLSGGVYTAEARAQLDRIGAPQLEKPISARDLRAQIRRIASDPTPTPV